MDHIQAFQVAALKCGFVDMDECGRGTVLWFKRAAIGATPETHQRLCVDTITDSATAYWTNAQGKITSKTFRSVAALQRWMSGNTLVEPLNTVRVGLVEPGSSSIQLTDLPCRGRRKARLLINELSLPPIS